MRSYVAETPIGTYHVDLWRGLFRDEVRVWKDVRPALGGLIASRRCRRGKGRGEAMHEDAVRALIRTLAEEGIEPVVAEPAPEA